MQLVVYKLAVKVASCDKALSLKPQVFSVSNLRPQGLRPQTSRSQTSDLKVSNLRPQGLKPSDLKVSDLGPQGLKPQTSRSQTSDLKVSDLGPPGSTATHSVRLLPFHPGEHILLTVIVTITDSLNRPPQSYAMT